MHLPKTADLFTSVTTIYRLLLQNQILHAVSLDYIIPLVSLNNLYSVDIITVFLQL